MSARASARRITPSGWPPPTTEPVARPTWRVRRGAPVLSDRFAPTKELPPVWPTPDGEVRGLAVEPLHLAVLELAADDPWMYDLLALIDGIRLGDARVRALARELLHERLAQAAPA